MKKISPIDLLSCIQGNVSIIKKLKLLDHEKIRNLFKKVAPIIMTKQYIYNALQNFKNGKSKQSDLQEWASFIRRGYLPSPKSTSISPLKIDYQREDEDVIVEVIAKLDQIGDKVDGKISKSDVDCLLNYLHH